MLDTDEAAAYEAWKLAKLTGSTDLSIRAYNAEMGALATAWDEGKSAFPEDQNPYRAAGMRGESR